ncbi:MAG: anti-sigma factor [Alphaproteobacteria bacterium]|nr:anti-sigma factor [Alphaproteobacteria bacterium]
MSVTQEQLMAYADGELAGMEKALVEAELATDADARATVERHRATRAKLSGAFAPILDEPVPQRLVDAVRPAPKTETANVVDIAAARAKKFGWTRREWGAMAACLMVGILFGGVALRKPDPMMVASNGALVANGALDRALDTQLASDAGTSVRIGLTFRGEAGEACRTYSYEGGGVSGLACREGETWRVQMAVASEPRAPSQFRTASVETPPALLALVEEKIAGETLDAAQEKAARDSGWRR